MVGVLQCELELEPEEEREVNFLLGVAFSEEEVGKLKSKYLSGMVVEKALENLKQYWNEKIEVANVKTPDEDFNRAVNIWLKYQLTQTRRVTRGLDRGYRDILTDLRGYIPLGPECVKRYLLETLKYQYADGSAMRQWSEVGGPHDLRNYKDSPSWIPDTLASYVKETGDIAILDEEKSTTNPMFECRSGRGRKRRTNPA
jgi:cellobiose phosphorylase